MGKLFLEGNRPKHPTPEGERTMKTEFKAKFLQHIKQKRQEEEGFTLIELLVVIIIIGILAAIALPNFLNQANRAKEVEAKNQLGAINRAQQSYRLDHTQFSADTTFAELNIGVKTAGENFNFVNNGAGPNTAVAYANAQDTSLTGYSGAIALNSTGAVAMGICKSAGGATAGATPNINTATPEITTNSNVDSCEGGS
jgi:type IV pilus assembly protein PilA